MEKTRQYTALAAALLLAGCATAGSTHAFVWAATGQSLSYREADGDGVAVAFRCPAPDLPIEVTVPGPDDRSFALRMRSVGTARSYVLYRQGEVLTGPIDRGDPVLAAFIATGKVSLRNGARPVGRSAADDAERAAIRRFGEACGIKRPDGRTP